MIVLIKEKMIHLRGNTGQQHRVAECGWLGSETKEGPYVMQDGSNRYGWDGKVEIRARVLRTGKQDGTLKGRQAGRQRARQG